jgi:drug/metabolite transporter (DMT)-like permease
LHSNLSGTFAFAFSWYLGMEAFSYGKLFGILACFAGAVCVGLSDVSGSNNDGYTIAGDVIALLVAVFYGLYTATLKYLVRDAYNLLQITSDL